MKIIIHFEDNGQDFLSWTCDATGMIVDAAPFQAWLWKGAKVINQPQIGKRVVIERDGCASTPLVIKHLVAKVEHVADEVAA